MRSAIASASSSAWEMKTVATLRAFSRSISPKKWRFSSGVSVAVGSSKMMVWAFCSTARAISTILLLGGAERHHAGHRVDVEVQRLQELLGRDVEAAQPVEGLLLAEIEVLRHRHRRHEAGLLEHHGDAVAQGLGRVLERHRLAPEQDGARRSASSRRRASWSASTCRPRSRRARAWTSPSCSVKLTFFTAGTPRYSLVTARMSMSGVMTGAPQGSCRRRARRRPRGSRRGAGRRDRGRR